MSENPTTPPPAAAAPRPPKKKKMSTLTKVLIGLAVGVIALIAVGALVLNSIFSGGNNTNSIAATDYLILSDEGVSNKVRVDGTIAPGEIHNVTTHLPAPINSINVEVGDRVELGQTLATIDTSTLSTDLESQRTQLDSAVTSAQGALSAAQTARDQYAAGINDGTNPEILAALAAQRAADEQVNLATTDLNTKINLRNTAAEAGEDVTTLDADIAAAESALRLATGAKSDADIGVTAARTAATTQLATLDTELNNARTGLTAAETSRNQTLGALQGDLDSATITAPASGVVMSVAKPGAPAAGPVVTIGDDSKLTITTSVREPDLPKIKEGNRVTFTAGATGTTEYTGTVTSVASIADSAQQASAEGSAMGSMGGGTTPTFTVTIEVTGNRDGLFLGSSVKANIITSEEENALAVPIDAVYTNDLGKDSVVVAVPTDNGSYTLEERTVETGLANDIDIAITGGDVAAGDMVLMYGEMYRYRVGETVTLNANVGSFGW